MIEWGSVAAAAAIMVTLGIFSVESYRARKAARANARREAVARVLDVVERASRAHVLLPISRVWTKPEMEMSLVLPRLVSELEPADRDVATWVARRIQRMQLARSDKDAIRIAQRVGFELAAWQHGSRPTGWFTAELVDDPFDPHLRIPKSTTVRRGITQAGNAAALGALFTAIVIAWRENTK